SPKEYLHGHVPDPDGSNSGVTVATGIDLGTKSPDEVDKLDIPTALKEKLKPYTSPPGHPLIKADAEKYVNKHPLTLTEQEAQQLDRAILPGLVSKVQLEYNSGSTGPRFEDLPSEA